MSRPARKFIVALDGMTPREALAMARKLHGAVWGFKVNDLLFADPGIVGKLKRHGRVFADAKLHDIPNTVANSVRRLSRAGANMISVHASGGTDMMRAAVRAAGGSRIVAVTVLTSRKADDREFKRLLKDSRAAGVHGIVCSAREVSYMKLGNLLTIVPGIRPAGYSKRDDQVRTATPQEALNASADLLVIGRPVTRARDPLKALNEMIPLEDPGVVG